MSVHTLRRVDRAFLGSLLGLFVASTACSPSDGPATTRLSLGALLRTVDADGTTVLVASLEHPDRSLVADRRVDVRFTSACTTRGESLMDDRSSTTTGIAAVSYQPAGCVGNDTVTAWVELDGVRYEDTVSLRISTTPGLSIEGALGKELFFDTFLSASGGQSCATCHDPANAYMASDGRAIPLGGRSLDVVGFRSTPSASYTDRFPAFGFDTATLPVGMGDDIPRGALGRPFGGLMWDGRVRDTAAQAVGPFTGPHEMANATAEEVRDRLVARPYLALFEAVFGDGTSSRDAVAVVADIASAIAVYEGEEASFVPFNSKFDAVVGGRAEFSAQEARGRALFDDPNRGDCIRCHDSTRRTPTAPQLFSDFTHRTLGVPRAWTTPYSVDATAATALGTLGLAALALGDDLPDGDHPYYDLGACGPFRTDATLDAPLCGAFRVAPLRNVALKPSYFHNGVFSTLREVLDFYVERDVDPGRFYVHADGTPDVAFNDLPASMRANVDVTRPPFRPSPLGARLTTEEVDDLIVFLCTLTDGYDPSNPAAYRLPAQCRAARR